MFMDNSIFNLKIFIEKCKTVFPKYISTLKKNNIPAQELNLTKKVILLYLKEYFKHNNSKFSRTRFNIDFINIFLSNLASPELLGVSSLKIQSIIAYFLNYLTLQNVLHKSIAKEFLKSSNFNPRLSTDKKSKETFSINKLSKFYKSCLDTKSSIKNSFIITLEQMGVSKKEYDGYLKNNLNQSDINYLAELQKDAIKRFNKEIQSPLYYFPDKRDYILKNWFCYEFTTNLIEMLEDYFFDDVILNTSDIILIENYIKFCFFLSVRITRTIITNNSPSTTTFFSKDLILKELENCLAGNLFLQENINNTSKTEIKHVVYSSLKEMIKFCHGCSNHCLFFPYDKCTMFEDPFYAMDLSEVISLNHMLNKKETPLPEIHYSQKEILAKTNKIYMNLLNYSERFSEGNFTEISVEDLKFLFEQYNKEFFSGLFEDLLNKEAKCKLVFRLSSRMTKSGGSTSKIIKKDQTIYKISVSSYLLFQSFSDIKRTIKISGITCKDRIEALQRIFEHELIHLLELLIKGDSSCSSDSFKILAKQIFLHTDNKHELITQEERAFLKFSIKVGDKVSFEYNTKKYIGIVDRITKRVTVLVKDKNNSKYANEEGFLKFYIPISMLNKEE